jgi:hypothetical protein
MDAPPRTPAWLRALAQAQHLRCLLPCSGPRNLSKRPRPSLLSLRTVPGPTVPPTLSAAVIASAVTAVFAPALNPSRFRVFYA